MELWEYNIFYPTFPILYQALVVKKRRLHVVGLNQRASSLKQYIVAAVAVKRSSALPSSLGRATPKLGALDLKTKLAPLNLKKKSSLRWVFNNQDLDLHETPKYRKGTSLGTIAISSLVPLCIEEIGWKNDLYADA